MAKNLTALIVDSSFQTRSRLKHVLDSTKCFDQLFVASNVNEAGKLLNQGHFVDVVFLSSSIGEAEVSNCAADLKNMYTAEKAAFIAVVEGGADQCRIASGLMDGIHGFLIAPYSVEAVSEVVRLARNIREYAMNNQLDKALGFYIDGLRSQLNDLARLRKEGRTAHLTYEIWLEMCSELPNLTAKTQELFLAKLIEELTRESSARTAMSKQAFSSGSFRVRRSLTSKALSSLRRAVG